MQAATDALESVAKAEGEEKIRQRPKNKVARQLYHYLKDEAAKGLYNAFKTCTSWRHFFDFWEVSHDIARQEKQLETTMEEIETTLEALKAKNINMNRGANEPEHHWKARVMKAGTVNCYSVVTGVTLVPSPYREGANADGGHPGRGGGRRAGEPPARATA